MKRRGYLEPEGHQTREKRILNRVLTWHAAETGRADMITYECDNAMWDPLVKEQGLEHGKNRDKTTPSTSPPSWRRSQRQERTCRRIRLGHSGTGA